ncbi:hypothetical protein A8709_15750 [Paenibacillus pectinilyticus]|uniref:SGNH hydrolase-type esterase domain-containing protein n=1 Tax=Paenibacillus pectinilyticus TaxID=512399 RepID=A0A1C1A4Q7_9BACL|nr:SGNH/GDSL hydrolase family protein [Paenibacillus pectinilyticus]OCT15528.1 hypothetical protein A8709_15750 [Paenibacillus pectinilyticus]
MGFRRQLGETFVFLGTEKQKMRYVPSSSGEGVKLRSHPDARHPECRHYQDGIDYMVDEVVGTISRLESGAIPDWRSHALCGKEKFDHRDYAMISNSAYTVYADYGYEEKDSDNESILARTEIASHVESNDGMHDTNLAHWAQKLHTKQSISLVVLGDSISRGAEIPDEKFTFAHCFTALLCERFPSAEVKLTMKAIGGESSEGGLLRLQEDVIALQPDLVTIGYGMNDQNWDADSGNGVPLLDFEHHIATMIEQVQAQTEAAIILITPCLPNPQWHFASENVTEYADTLRLLAKRYEVTLADVQKLWIAELAAGKSTASLLMNNVNHPNEYGHSIYTKALAEVL